MDRFLFRNGEFFCESVPLSRIGTEVGTPAYVYSRAALDANCRSFRTAFAAYPTLPCFAVKANSSLQLLKLIFSLGFGADVVSRGELERALVAGCDPQKIVFSGVGKTDEEMARGLEVGIRAFNVESGGELFRLAALAKARGTKARVSLRLNPNIDAKTHPHIATGLYSTKFGIAEEEARELVDQLSGQPSLQLVGLACHLGSQITELEPFRLAARRLAEWAQRLGTTGWPLQWLDLGGGLGIRYHNESPPAIEAYADALITEVRKTQIPLLVEPGRALVGDIGCLLTRVLEVKRTGQKTFVIVDAAMTELIRPSLYDAFHEILPVRPSPNEKPVWMDIVGPVCETTDYLGRDRNLPPVKPGELMLVRNAGAYAASMASNYNTRPRAPEVLVDGNRYAVIRPREKLETLWASESA